MKTKYKIIIASILVFSMLTAFAVTSFAAEVHTDIEYNDNTYTYNTSINNNEYLQIWGFDSITIVYPSGSSVTYDYDYIIIDYRMSADDDVTLYYHSSTPISSYILDSNQVVNIILTGNYKYGFVNSLQYSDNVTNINNTNSYEYDVWYKSSVSSTNQINLLNNNQPNPLDKVNDFLGYLSTSLTKLTTMIITNQILILFIVAVPVVSFVIGSFKRIKDAGRV